MDDSELSDAQKAARDEVHDLLQRHASLLGPWAETDDMEAPDESVFLEGWVLMASWTDGAGVGWLTRIPAKNLPNYARAGLLHEGLYGFED